MANFHQTNRFWVKLRLLLPENLPDTALPKVPSHCGRIRFAAHHDPDHGLLFQSRAFFVVMLADPQIKKLSSSELSSLDEIVEGRLPADPLLRAEPLLWLQRLDLGQLFPALFPAAREDFPSSGSPRAGKKAVLVTTFSFGRLVCSFHEAGIIMKFVWNIQRFVFFVFPAFVKDVFFDAFLFRRNTFSSR